MLRFVAIVCLGAFGNVMASHQSTAPLPQQPRDEKASKFEPGALGMKVPVLTVESFKDYDKYVGRLVAVRGTVSNTKIPRIAGVDVHVPDGIEREKDDCYAVGILTKWTIRPQDIPPGVANRGPGTFYILYSDLRGTLAEAKHVPRK